MKRRGILILILLAAGCRLGFDPPPPIHHYPLQGTYADEHGGPDLVPQGGQRGDSGYEFAANQGLELSDAMPATQYTIVIKLSLNTTSGLRKIVDFKAKTSNNGLYVHNSDLAFYTGVYFAPPNASERIAAATPIEITLSRDDSGRVIGYVNGAVQFDFQDEEGHAAFTDPRAVAYFVMDDVRSAIPQASSGVVREIRIWDVVLTEDQIKQLK